MPNEQVVVITGAGSGIGRAAALELAKVGMRVVLVGRTRSNLEQTAQLIADRPDGASSHTRIVDADVAETHRAVDVINQTVAHFGRVDVLVNNAGLGQLAGIESVSDALLQQTFAVNVFGPAHMIAAAWPHFVGQGRGCVINVCSMAVVSPFPGLSAYAAAKSALDSLTRSIVNERGDHDIAAYSIAPGAVETAMLRSMFSADEIPLEQTLDPQAIADVITQCALGQRRGDDGSLIQVLSG